MKPHAFPANRFRGGRSGFPSRLADVAVSRPGVLACLSTLAILVTVGCRPSEEQRSATESPPAEIPVNDDLARALREYVTAQEVHFAEHATYAAMDWSLRPYLEDNDSVVRTIVTWSPAGHSAVARLRDRFDIVCGIAIGDAAPPLLDGAPSGNVTCRTGVIGRVGPRTPSGLLLGMTSLVNRRDIPVPRHLTRTQWIVFAGDSAELAVSGPGLVAPRDDGFWRFDLVEDVRRLDAIVAETPGGQRDTVVKWGEGVDPNDYESVAVSIQFIGPRHLGYGRFSQELEGDGEHISHGGKYDILGPDLEPVDLESIAGPAALARLREQEEENRCTEFDHWTWTIARAPGHWVFRAFQATSLRVCGSGDEETGIPPDSGIVGHPPVALDLARLVVPDARDAVLSPAREAIVAVTSDSIYAFTVSPTVFGPPQAVAPAGFCEMVTTAADPTPYQVCYFANIVMAEWALGRHVSRWTTELNRLLAR